MIRIASRVIAWAKPAVPVKEQSTKDHNGAQIEINPIRVERAILRRLRRQMGQGHAGSNGRRSKRFLDGMLSGYAR